MAVRASADGNHLRFRHPDAIDSIIQAPDAPPTPVPCGPRRTDTVIESLLTEASTRLPEQAQLARTKSPTTLPVAPDRMRTVSGNVEGRPIPGAGIAEPVQVPT